MQDVCKLIGRVAPLDVTVLITGESGTGKELVARALFHHSSRADKPFLAINCAAIPETLLESELFGHERGAFTGAERRRIGKFEQAHQGTLFLDEIGDMTAATQAKMLRVLQEQRFDRVGGDTSIQTDVRLIAATNKDLEKEVAAGRFRSDLFYRLNGFTIHLPALRERREDLPMLIDHFVRIFGRTLKRPDLTLAPEVRELPAGPRLAGQRPPAAKRAQVRHDQGGRRHDRPRLSAGEFPLGGGAGGSVAQLRLARRDLVHRKSAAGRRDRDLSPGGPGSRPRRARAPFCATSRAIRSRPANCWASRGPRSGPSCVPSARAAMSRCCLRANRSLCLCGSMH